MDLNKALQSPWLNGAGGLVGTLILFYTNPHAVGQYNFLRLAGILVLLFLLVRTFYYGVVKKKPKGSKLFSALVGILVLFFVLEGIFMQIRTTVGTSQALCTRGWFEKYWQPLISPYDFRDSQTVDKEAIEGKVHISFLGDSFAAGQGIKDTHDRFPDLVREQLPADWCVFNHAYCGADTWDELMVMDKMPYEDIHPRVVVLQWFVNDIEGAASRLGLEYVPELPLMQIPLLNLLIERSYFFNYLYVHTPWQTDFGYGKFLKAAYGNPSVNGQYEKEFAQLVSWVTETEQAQLLVVLFPSMSRPEASREYLSYAQELSIQHNLPVIDMTETVLSLSPQERRVNAFDDHPSKKVHALTAEAILSKFEQQGWLDSVPPPYISQDSL